MQIIIEMKICIRLRNKILISWKEKFSLLLIGLAPKSYIYIDLVYFLRTKLLEYFQS